MWVADGGSLVVTEIERWKYKQLIQSKQTPPVWKTLCHTIAAVEGKGDLTQDTQDTQELIFFSMVIVM